MFNIERIDWNTYFINITKEVTKRSTCMRRMVGAIVVKENLILSTGYNGTPIGIKHCEDIGCIRNEMNVPSGERHELCRGLHAEQNTIINATKTGVNLEGSTIYITHSPCIICSKMIINAGIKKVVYTSNYSDELSIKFLKEADIKIEQYNEINGETIVK